MLQSHIITIDGAFVGAAVRLDRGYRFVATDQRVGDLHGAICPSLEEVRHRANRLWRGVGLQPVQTPVPPPGAKGRNSNLAEYRS